MLLISNVSEPPIKSENLQTPGKRVETYIYIYDDYNESFEKLLERDRSFTTHEINIPQLVIEISSQP